MHAIEGANLHIKDVCSLNLVFKGRVEPMQKNGPLEIHFLFFCILIVNNSSSFMLHLVKK